eukprot:GHVS01105890.1.p1 GENE.GHVS01105890.1~~GHVS01105890.1.p1  ORF type:complete len:184 (+),score=15.58 GHVS01105890.1:288-839(+)
MMIKYLLIKPPGGGPAPLVENKLACLLWTLACLHLFLAALSSFCVVFPTMVDVSCLELDHNLTFCIVTLLVGLGLSVYYSLIALKKLGTEKEWAYCCLFTIGFALLDIVWGTWGCFVLYYSSDDMFTKTTLSQGCEKGGSWVLYFSSCLVIVVHMLVVFFCVFVAVRLSRNVTEQLEGLRQLT